MQRHITRSQIQKLAAQVHSPAVSIYVEFQPDKKLGLHKDKKQLRELVDEAKRFVKQHDVRLDVDDFMLSLENLIQNDEFWESRTYGAAFFVSATEFEWFSLSKAPENIVISHERFHLLPVLPNLNHRGEYYILALSRRNPRLLHATRSRVRLIELSAMPDSLDVVRIARAMSEKTDVLTGRQRDVRSIEKEELLSYCRAIDKAVQPMVGSKRLPLVIVGLPKLQSMFRSVSTYHFKLERGLSINPDQYSHSQLSSLTWPMVSQLVADTEKDIATVKFRRYKARPKRVVHGFRDIARAAYEGRIDTLLVKKGAHIWGKLNTEFHEIETHNSKRVDDGDLLNLVALEALNFKGTIVEIDDEKELNGFSTMAILRY